MSLRSPTLKMSKSDASEISRINLTDSADDIKLKISKAVTDCISAVTYNPGERPGVSNLLRIYSSFSGMNIEAICEKFIGKQTVDLKIELADLLITSLNPLRECILNLLDEQNALDAILEDGNLRAREIASCNLKKVKQVLGLS